MKYFFVSEQNGSRHIIAALSRESALSIAAGLTVKDFYELTKSSFNLEGFLISDTRDK